MSKKTLNKGSYDYYEDEDEGYSRKSTKQVKEDRERKNQRRMRNNLKTKNLSSFYEDDSSDNNYEGNW